MKAVKAAPVNIKNIALITAGGAGSAAAAGAVAACGVGRDGRTAAVGAGVTRVGLRGCTGTMMRMDTARRSPASVMGGAR